MMETSLIQNIEDLNRIPETWKVYNYEAVVSDCSSGNKKLAKSDYLKDGEIAIIDQGQRLIAGYSNDVNLKVKSKPPYIIFGDHTRAFKFIDFPFIMGADGTKVLKPKNDSCDTKYLYYFFYSLAIPNTGYNRHYKYLKNAKIPLPSLTEQKRIAAILDAADVYRQKTKALISKYDELAQSLFLEMFGDPVSNPMGWEKKSLDEMLVFLTSGSRGWAKYYSEVGDVFLRIQNIGYDKLTIKELTYINAPNSAESKRTKVQSGDIVLSITADLGRTAVIPESFPKAYISQHLAILRLEEEYVPRFVSAYIASNGGQLSFKKLDKGGVKAGLNFTDIKSYEVFIPPNQLQTQFAQRIEAIEQQKAQAEKSLAQAEDLFGSLLQRAFRGELN